MLNFNFSEKSHSSKNEPTYDIGSRESMHNKTGTSKVGAISNAQKAQVFKLVKVGTLRAFWKSSLLQNIK